MVAKTDVHVIFSSFSSSFSWTGSVGNGTGTGCGGCTIAMVCGRARLFSEGHFPPPHLRFVAVVVKLILYTAVPVFFSEEIQPLHQRLVAAVEILLG